MPKNSVIATQTELSNIRLISQKVFWETSKIQHPLFLVSTSQVARTTPIVRETINKLQGVPCARRLGFVDLDFECSTVCPTLLGLMGIWQKRLGKMVEQRNQSQSNPGTWDRCPVHTSETSFNPRSTSSTNAMTPCLRAERNESISQRILTSARVRTRGAQGNQIHISTLWTLGIPKKCIWEPWVTKSNLYTEVKPK